MVKQYFLYSRIKVLTNNHAFTGSNRKTQFKIILLGHAILTFEHYTLKCLLAWIHLISLRISIHSASPTPLAPVNEPLDFVIWFMFRITIQSRYFLIFLLLKAGKIKLQRKILQSANINRKMKRTRA